MAGQREKFRYASFGQRLKQWRRAIYPPVTQRDLAQKLGVSAGYIAHLENGRTLPGRETLKALARALGVPETEMLKEAGFLSSVTNSDEELLDDPELRLFFREEWQELSEEEKEWFRGFIRMIKETRRQRKLQQT